MSVSHFVGNIYIINCIHEYFYITFIFKWLVIFSQKVTFLSKSIKYLFP